MDGKRKRMKQVSLVVIGTELTRGIIEDKHTSVVAREITRLGLHFRESVQTADDGTIKEALSFLLPHNDIIIITGGLGPTSDDMTRAAIAEAAGRKLIRNEGAWKHLMETLGDRAYGANERQALIPEGFTVIPNPNGTAPGFYGECGHVLLISLPGPPREMRPMLYDPVLPLIAERYGLERDERDEYTSLITAEAKLEEMCEQADSSLEWGTRFQDYRISLYVSGKDKETRDSAVEKLRALIGEHRIERGDTSALELLVAVLKEKNATISCAESCTGGLAASLLTSIPGSSEYMLGGVVSYSPEVKKGVLGVKESTVERYGVVSEECAREMSDGVREKMHSDYAFSITGVAGPDKSEGKEVGTVCFGFSGKGIKTETVTLYFPSWGRESIRRRSSVTAFILMKAFILGEDIKGIVSSWKVF